MTTYRNRVLLQHILKSATAIESYVRGMPFNEFENDEKTQDAVIRKFEIIGEATKNLTTDFRLRYNDLPWRKVCATS